MGNHYAYSEYKEMKRVKKRIFEIIQIGSNTDFISRVFDIFIVIVILLNLLDVFGMTFEQLSPYANQMHMLELVTSIIFLIEYVLRVWTSDLLYPNESRFKAFLTYFVSLWGLIDLLSFLPFFLPFFFPSGVVAFRIFRVIRIFRLFRLNVQYDGFNLIVDVIKERSSQLFFSIMIILILMLASSLFMYNLEHEAQPDLYRNAFSGIWWSVSALLTVGYGDIYPITTAGRIVGIIIAFLGVFLVSIPTGIISAGFVEKYSEMKRINQDKIAGRFIISKVTSSHPWIGMKVSDVVLPPDMEVANIVRGEKCISAIDAVIKKNDHVVIYNSGQGVIE